MESNHAVYPGELQNALEAVVERGEHTDNETAMDHDPVTLAASLNTAGEASPRRKRIRIPFLIIFMLLWVLTTSIIITPVSIISVLWSRTRRINSMHVQTMLVLMHHVRQNMVDWANVSIKQSADQAVEYVMNMQTQIERIITDWGSRRSVTNAVTTNMNDLQSLLNDGSPLLFEAGRTLDLNRNIKAMFCASREGVNGPMPRIDPDAPNFTEIVISRPANLEGQDDQLLLYAWMDYSTNLHYRFSMSVNGEPFGPAQLDERPRNFNDDAYYWMIDAADGQPMGRWHITYPLDWESAMWTFSRVLYGNSAQPTVPTHVCTAASPVESTINPFLDRIKPTENSVIVIYNTKTLETIGSSLANTVKDNARMTVYTFATSPHPTIRSLAAALTPDTVAALSTRAIVQTQVADHPFFITGRPIQPDAETEWMMIIAVPTSDVYGALEYTIKIVAGVVGATGAAVWCTYMLSGWWSAYPLRRLDKRMKEVTMMKFNQLYNSRLDNRSYIREIADLEDSFHTMVKSFAAGLQKNSVKRNIASRGTDLRAMRGYGYSTSGYQDGSYMEEPRSFGERDHHERYHQWTRSLDIDGLECQIVPSV
ncbi:hypothetical protein BC832DRAFT_556393 [Gaertneriomyces semiglobifer]|nr:hypothetical protein BC832DRAFT_556393 [Gaertneriomyces semiglobifer]